MTAATISGSSRRTNRRCSTIFSRPSPLPPKRLFPPKQRRIWDEAQDTATTLDKGHGRRERRTLKATTALNGYLDWPGVAQVGQIESVVEQDGKMSHETRYFITSAPRELADAGVLLSGARGHWSIENRSHYVRDVTLGEDAVASARAAVRRSWPPCAMRRLASSELPGRPISPRPSGGTLLRSEGSSPDWASSRSEEPCPIGQPFEAEGARRAEERGGHVGKRLDGEPDSCVWG